MKTKLEWLLSIIAAFLLLQTLYFKFSGSEESVYIFTTVGMEPWGRIGSGIVELIASVMLLTKRLKIYGALVALAVISGAIFFHLTSLGIVVMNDGGLLFYYALAIFLCSIAIIFFRKSELPIIGSNFK